MKAYSGRRNEHGDTNVYVSPRGDQAHVYGLPHIPHHSPTGFEWGYGGSGPADLALAILADYFGETPEAVKASLETVWAPRTKTQALYQGFKWTLVAGFGADWSLTAEQIEEWLGTLQAQDLLHRLEAANEAYAAMVREEEEARNAAN